MREVALRAAYLPDPRVLQSPADLEPLEQLAHQRPDGVVGRRPVCARLVEGVDYLAVHVELELLGGRVTDAYWLRVLVAGQPLEHALVEPPLAAESVHDLDVRRIAGHGAEEPIAPAVRLVLVAGSEHREQRQRRVAQPAEAIVPVAGAADPLGQRRRRCGDEPARRRVGECLQDE